MAMMRRRSFFLSMRRDVKPICYIHSSIASDLFKFTASRSHFVPEEQGALEILLFLSCNFLGIIFLTGKFPFAKINKKILFKMFSFIFIIFFLLVGILNGFSCLQ